MSLIVLLLATLSLKAELVNGSFEENGFSGWEVYECRLIGQYPGAPANTQPWGMNSAVSAKFPIGAALAQGVAVRPGGAYTLGFYFACINNDTRAVLGVGVFTMHGQRIAVSPAIQGPCGLGPDGFAPHNLSFVVPNDISVVHIRFVSYSLGRGSFALDAVTLDGPPPPPRPSLQILAPIAGQIELRWPVSAIGFTLQMTPDPNLAGSWQLVDVAQAKNDGQNWSLQILLETNSPQGYFRLSAAPLPAQE